MPGCVPWLDCWGLVEADKLFDDLMPSLLAVCEAPAGLAGFLAMPERLVPDRLEAREDSDTLALVLDVCNE